MTHKEGRRAARIKHVAAAVDAYLGINKSLRLAMDFHPRSATQANWQTGGHATLILPQDTTRARGEPIADLAEQDSLLHILHAGQLLCERKREKQQKGERE